jgi:Fe-S cluster biogenesis protein NfuA
MAAGDETRGSPGVSENTPGVRTAASNGGGPDALMQRVQRLTGRLEEIADPGVRETAEELVSTIIELYGEGLERVFAALDDAGEAGAKLREQLSEDGVVASLMLIHGLFPVDLETRVGEALDSVRPYMESHGGNVELLALEDGVARIRLEGSCESCPASSSTLELAIKQALDEAAPDLEGLIVEGIEGPGSVMGAGAMELPVVQVAPGTEGIAPSWFDLDGVRGLDEGELKPAEVEGIGLLVARVEGSLLAYRDACPGCGSALAAQGELTEGILACPGCERRYVLQRAGRSLGEERMQLEPVPLLAGGAGVRVALAA